MIVIFLANFIKLKHTLREDILAGTKFGGFGGFCQKSGKFLIKSGLIFTIRQIKFPPKVLPLR